MANKDDVISVTKVRENLADIVGEVRFAHKRIKLSSNGKNIGAIVPLEDLELLEAIEDKVDIELAQGSLKVEGSSTVDEVLEEFGLTREELTAQTVKPKRKATKVS